MAGAITNISRPAQFYQGLDRRSSDLLRNPDAATTAKNSIYLATENLSARRGYRWCFASSGGLGSGLYVHQDASTGADASERLLFGQSLYRVATGTLAITYSGSGTNVYCDCYPVGTGMFFQLVVDDVVAYSKELSLGFDESSPVTLTTLTSEIDALTDFAATNTGSAQAAASLPTLVEEYFVSGALSISYEYQETVPQPTSASNPFAGAWAARNASSFEFPTFCTAANVFYIGSRYDDEHKYDGQKIYRSGMPKPSTPSASVVANATGRTGTNIRYRVSFVQVDNRGNRNEGIISDESGTVSPSADYVDVTYTSLAATSGFNTDCGMFAGAQVSQTTLNVDDGSGGNHTLKVGDTAYFYDSVSAQYVEREITAVTGTTITISGAAVTVADNDPVSANLRVAVYTQSVASGDYYLVGEYPHNRWVATPTIRDLGAALGAQYIFPLDGAEPGLPPRCQYRAMYRGLKFLSGELGEAAQDGVYYSDIASPEYYPTSGNQFDIRTNRQAKHSGLFPTNEYLIIQKSNSLHAVIGDNDENGFFQYRVDEISLSTGGKCHHAMDQIYDGSVLILNDRGLYLTKAGSLPQEISGPILSDFRVMGTDTELKFERAWGRYDPKTARYYLFLPAESSSSGSVYANLYSKMFVFDFSAVQNGGPLRITEWDNINAGGGFIVDGDETYFCERRLSSFSSTVATNLYKFGTRGDVYDQVDHSEGFPAVSFEYACGWEDGGDPSAFKKPQRLKVFSLDPVVPSQFTLTVQTEINFVSNAVCENTYSFGAGTGNAGWDLDAWSTSAWDPPAEPELEQKLGRIKCKSWRYRFIHAERYERPIISGWQTEVVVPFRSKIKE